MPTLRFGDGDKRFYTWIVVQLDEKLEEVGIGEAIRIECLGFDDTDPDYPIKQFEVQRWTDDD